MTAYFDFTDPLMQSDRFEYYRRFRESDPIHRTPYGYWVMTRYADVDALLRTPTVSSNFPADEAWAKVRGGRTCPVVRSASTWLLMQDGDAHKRLRRIVGRVFTPRMIEKIRPRIVQVVNDLADEMGDGEVELIQSLALPLPIFVIGELLGIPADERHLVRVWTDEIGHAIAPGITPEIRIAMNKAQPEFAEYMRDLMDRRRADEPGDDLLSVMMRSGADGEEFSEHEIIANIGLLFNAGHETTVNLMANGLVALLQQPEAMRQLRDDRSLMDSALEELSRFDPPVRFAARILTEDVEIAGTHIPAGETVITALDAIGRDPERYPDPERLDLRRADVKSMAFSAGPHHCMGKTLGKLEATVVFDTLLDRYRKIELASDELIYQKHFNLRGLAELRLRLTA